MSQYILTTMCLDCDLNCNQILESKSFSNLSQAMDIMITDGRQYFVEVVDFDKKIAENWLKQTPDAKAESMTLEDKNGKKHCFIIDRENRILKVGDDNCCKMWQLIHVPQKI